mmetsp:Transcript_5989/g.19472  ORF Transcript_5989/g.19472 Transcript_5989/m.19472 type:complete len:624 (-) Transcript_5989:300-2171(-)
MSSFEERPRPSSFEERPRLMHHESMDLRRGLRRKSWRSMPELGRDVGDDVRMHLYSRLPFVAVGGMSTQTRRAVREVSVRLEKGDRQKLLAKGKRTGLYVSSGYLFPETDQDQEVEELLRHDRLTWPLVASACLACVSQFLFGYNTSVMNAPEGKVFQGKHSRFAWAFAVAAFALGGPVGAAVGGIVSNRRGRKFALMVDAFLFLVGGLMQCVALSMLFLTLGRFVVGAASGFSSVLVPVYLGELAPPVLRGTFGTAAQMGLVTGILGADVAAFLLPLPFFQTRPWSWRLVPFGISPFLALMQLIFGIGAAYVVESPRWLLDKEGPASQKARNSLKLLHDFQDGKELENEISNIVEANDIHKTTDDHDTSLDDISTVSTLLADTATRPVLMTCLLYHVAQQLSGINAVFFYSSMFFRDIVPDPLVATTSVAVVNVVAVYFALLLMDHVGRRTLLAASCGGMLLCVLILTAALLLGGGVSTAIAVVALALYVFFFELGLGPIAWLIVAELFEARAVDAAQSLASQVNWLASFLVGLGFPTLNDVLGPYTFLPFGLVLALTLLFTLLKFPETKDKSPRDIIDLLHKKKHEKTRPPDLGLGGKTKPQARYASLADRDPLPAAAPPV